MYAFIWMHAYVSIVIYIIYINSENRLAVLIFNFNESSDF